MLKTLLSPIQQWLLRNGQCVGCGMPLKKGQARTHRLGELVTCKCGRHYFKLKNGSWRRALMSEVRG